MSELRVDNIVSEDGSAAPIYSKGMTIGAGQTLTCSGDFSVGGNVTFDSGATVTGVVTFTSADLQTNLSVSSLNVSGVSTISTAVTATSDGIHVGAGKSIRLHGATSGYSEIIAAAGSASTTYTLPANGGSASQYLQTDGSGVLSWATVTSDSAPYFTGQHTADTTLPHSTLTELTDYSAYEVDPTSTFASGRFTPSVAGTYFVTAGGSVTSPGERVSLEIRVYKNGSGGTLIAHQRDMVGPSDGVWQVSCHVNSIVALNGTTDYISMWATSYNYTDGTDNNSRHRSFSAIRIGD